jgi:hypothetical protein
VKRYLTIFCFATIVTAGTELHQLFKLPVFIQHFYEHQQEDKNISLLRFVVIHYFSGNPKDSDYNRDMQLPFKTADCSSTIALAALTHPSFTNERPVFTVANNYPALKNNTFLSSHFSDIWQPPRIS